MPARRGEPRRPRQAWASGLLALAGDRGADRPDRRCSSGGGSRTDSPQPRALLPRRRRRPDRASASRRSTSRARPGQLGLAELRAVLLRALPRRAHRRAAHGPERRPVPAADGRAADRGRRDRDLPPRPERRVQAGPLDRDRRRAVRVRADPACAATTAILEQYKYLFGIGAIVLLFLPRLPVHRRRRSTARGCGCASARSSSSPASSRRSS